MSKNINFISSSNNNYNSDNTTKTGSNLNQKERTSFFINWYKSNKEAKIPTKRVEDAGFDIYTVENDVWLKPHQTRLFSTGVHYSFNHDNKNPFFIVKDRGSTGSKGLHCHCGVCDNGYRGEVFVALCNTNSYPVLFTDKVDKIIFKKTWYGKKYMCYPTSKGIAQLVLFEGISSPYNVRYFDSLEEWEKCSPSSERGETKLGQSGK